MYLQMLAGRPTVDGRPGEDMPPLDFDQLKEDLLEKHGEPITEKELVSAALYPKVFDEFKEMQKKYGPVEKLDTKTFLVGPSIAHVIDVSNIFLNNDLEDLKVGILYRVIQ